MSPAERVTTGARPGLGFRLDDRYRLESGTVLLSGIQALVRLPLDWHRADARRGLRTAIFVSGYQGSPLGGYDLALAREAALLGEHDVCLVPAVNEELAATAVWGSQQERLGALAGYDGVVGIWYGKAPGVDRSGDAFKHANLMGVGRNGGVLALAGDDPVSKSSTIPSHSEPAFADAQMPVLVPGNPQEIVDLGLHGFAMSRFSGLWVGMKIVTDVADGFATAAVGPDRFAPVEPVIEVDGRPWRYRQGELAIPPRNLVEEHDLVYGRLPAALAYARANGLNQVTVLGGERARLGIVAAGKTYHDVVEALARLGFDHEALDAAGVRLLKLGMVWPLEPEVVRAFADGLQEVLVVEEKRAFVETQLRAALYELDSRPRIVGKDDEHGRHLVPADAELTPDRVLPVLSARLRVVVPEALVSHAPEHATRSTLGRVRTGVPVGDGAAVPQRAPFFCSGCPHNRSTVVPEGSVAGGGIGCHTMAVFMDRDVVSLSQMGGEGSAWIGRAPFTDRRHIFQNIGDGTYAHSGSLAVRACVAAGVDITFKLLYNDAVAMTGGQHASGAMDVPALTRELDAEGVQRVIVCSEDPKRFGRRARWGRNVSVWHRERLDEAQRVLRDVAGVTVIVYDQACAAERRRARRRGKVAEAPMRVFIDEAVCEGCGDCGAKSNCLSVQPVDTEYGRKTRIHQSSCNQDYTCLDGDCPSFVTVTETRRSRRRRARRLAATSTAPAEAGGGGAPALDASFPEPEREPLDGTHDIYMTGVGGTGVITASQILATAALLDGLHVAGVDQTGLSQKGGPVVSHLRVGAQPFEGAGTIGAGAADTYLAFDLLVGAAPVHLAYARHGTRTAVSTSKVPTGAMVSDPALAFPAVDALVGAIGGRTGGVDVHLDSVALAERLFGDHMMANVLLLGAAYQAGMLPVTADAIERAIELNGVARDQNRQAFRWGRRYTLDPGGVARAAYGAAPVPVAISSNGHGPRPAAALLQGAGFTGELARLLEVRVPELAAYQDDAYARAYVDFVARVVEVERAAVPGATRLAEAVARSLFQLMAYKDEYEVARLYLRDDFAATLRAEAPDGGAVRVLLHPPLLRALGVRRKLAFGPWVRPAFRVLRGMRRVRGTRLDPFGATKVRRTERALVAEYRGLVERALHELSAETYDRAVALAELPAMVRGYEQVKLENVERFRAEVRALGF